MVLDGIIKYEKRLNFNKSNDARRRFALGQQAAIVLFAHGSGISRRSPRNKYVANML
jgi:hypothetical protein